MKRDEWSLLFRQYRTRNEIRRVLLTEIHRLLGSNKGPAPIAEEISHLATDSDQEVLESFDKLQKFCSGMKGPARSSVASAIGLELHELFATALERMNQIPPESVAFRRTRMA